MNHTELSIQHCGHTLQFEITDEQLQQFLWYNQTQEFIHSFIHSFFFFFLNIV